MSAPLQPELLQEPPDERQSAGYVGMVVFLGSWAMMFAALFFSYALLRSRSSEWPPPGVEPLPLLLPGINTVILALSSLTMHLGLRALRQTDIRSFRYWLLITIAHGLIFMALQLTVWMSVWSDGLQLSTGTYGGVFYLLTVFHALHVLVGLGLLLWLVAPTIGNPTAAAPRRIPVKLTSMFWHFVDVVWALMFVTVYLL